MKGSYFLYRVAMEANNYLKRPASTSMTTTVGTSRNDIHRIDMLKLEEVDELARRPNSVVVSASRLPSWLKRCFMGGHPFSVQCSLKAKVRNKWNYVPW